MENKIQKFTTSEKIITSEHIASTIQADTLFTFTKKSEYMFEWLKAKQMFPRYNREDVEYLRLNEIKRIAYPMKCFCDINLHKLEDHLRFYGYYGLAFTKEWGMKKGIQPVHYINSESELANDFSAVIEKLFKEIGNEVDSEELSFLKSYTIHQLMYSKPYSGKMGEQEKCFTDECEWRFVPNVSDILPQVLYEETQLQDDFLNILSLKIKKQAYSLEFEYKDIKYIILNNEKDLQPLSEFINETEISETDKYLLMSKIIVWDKSKGDF